MTRETAKIKVELLDNYLSHTCQDYGERDHEAMMMAIKALEQEPTTRNCFGCKYAKDNHNSGTEECHLCMWENQYTPTTKNDLGVDCISRQAAIDVLTKTSGIRGDALKALYDLPSVTPQEPRWIPVSEKLPNDRFTNTVGWELRAKTPEEIKKECSEIIQQKINKLKGNENGND